MRLLKRWYTMEWGDRTELQQKNFIHMVYCWKILKQNVKLAEQFKNIMQYLWDFQVHNF